MRTLTPGQRTIPQGQLVARTLTTTYSITQQANVTHINTHTHTHTHAQILVLFGARGGVGRGVRRLSQKFL